MMQRIHAACPGVPLTSSYPQGDVEYTTSPPGTMPARAAANRGVIANIGLMPAGCSDSVRHQMESGDCANL